MTITKIQFDLLAFGMGIIMFFYGSYINRSWLLYDSRLPPKILGILLFLIGVLDFVFG